MKKGCFIFVFLILFTSIASASTFYVSPTGKDSTCTAAQNQATPAGPTLQFIMGCMVGSDVLIGRNGIYTEPLHKTGFNGLFPNGIAGAPTIFKSFPGEKVTLMSTPSPWGAIFEFDAGASYITFDGINFDGYVAPELRGFSHEYVMLKLQATTHHIRIINGEAKNLPDGWFSSNSGDNNEISGFKIHDYFPASSYLSGGTGCGQITCWGYPFYWNGKDNKILNNEIYNFPSFGVHLYCSGLAYCNYPTRFVIQGNNIHDYGIKDPNRGAGILVAQGDGTQVLNNVIWNSPSWVQPIVIGDSATNYIIQCNTYVKPLIINLTDIKTNRTYKIGPNRYSLTIDIKPTDTIIINGVKK